MREQLISNVQERMDKAVQNLRREFASVRAGRATPAMLDKVLVDYYGSQMPVNQVASVTTPEPRLLVISPWEKSMLSEIEKAIQKSDLGLNPSNDGTVIRLTVPALTEERRQELVKQVRKLAEEARVAIRNVRRDGNDELKKLEKNGDVSEDEVRRLMDKIQQITDKCIAQVDSLLEDKEKDVTQV
ncbi:ribosome recycling factor [Alicyclobacillus hesperidum URH17-3-68]|uniref:Ribosome-recycling factor n=1 Tax=Alicyclobacillus hesperidum TaxID=89784 RepID=A0A1H2SI01_9BACL|nr:ribosome recycling factor [Alicyclobacillus hesperidum]EJY55616.1 ribosome recycling factor [Alicyclobacillus hesperidum URH17-3-68]GLG00590.1 ribosome-recycling factor [Alicyclobacillus hesperidum subsp. aegles]GLV12390.1 ribosome-recycling factor [Alicyclobacillus hesperidum]SDW31276.1 ribosome recycling factor [Alicyclobacillus hesperidum]